MKRLMSHAALYILVTSTLLCAAPGLAQSPGAPAQPSKPMRAQCTVNNELPTDGDNALARKDYDAALKFYGDAVTKSPDSMEARLGLVRALIGKNKTTEATAEAKNMLVRQPHSAVAEVAAGEAAFRNADFGAANDHAAAALKEDLCEGRGLALMAQLYDVRAYFAQEAKSLHNAHLLRPNDELIRREWISSLPRKERQDELQKYLGANNSLSERDRADYVNEEDHLKARRRGECHVTSKASSTKIPFVPVFEGGGLVVPSYYGLNVSLNGKRRTMQIDTGASGILLGPGAAKRLGLKPEYTLHTGGIGDEGEVSSYLSHVETIQIGDVTISDCMVEVLSKDRLDGGDGLIGIDVFDRWVATLDYPNKQLELAPLPPRPGEPATNSTGNSGQQPDDADDDTPHDAITPESMKDWLHVIRIGHLVMLPSTLNKTTNRFLVMDTGAGNSTLSPAMAQDAGKLHDVPGVTFQGISGKVKKVQAVDNASLIFGHLRLPPVSFYSIDFTSLSHDAGTEISGLLGLPILRRLTISIDYRDNLIRLSYDWKNDPAH